MAGTSQLKFPPADIHSRALDIVLVPPASLWRVSRYKTNEPHFGKTASHRFDDTNPVIAKRFGTCYLGFNLTVAFAESVLHALEPDAKGFSVTKVEARSRFVLSFKPQKRGTVLRLAKMYGTALLRLGGNGEISGTSDYTVPQAWATALVAHPDKIDGFIYMSRRVNNDFAVVLFQRNSDKDSKIHLHAAIPLFEHKNYLATQKELSVILV